MGNLLDAIRGFIGFQLVLTPLWQIPQRIMATLFKEVIHTIFFRGLLVFFDPPPEVLTTLWSSWQRVLFRITVEAA